MPEESHGRRPSVVGVLTRAAAGVVSTAALVSLGMTAQAATTTPHRPSSALTASARQVDATGDFQASVDFSTLVTRPVGMMKCEFSVQGTLTFTGTVVGVASGTTAALIDAPCPEALTNPPGTFRDVFRFEGQFSGTVAEVPVDGRLSYAGVTRPGGSIDATILVRAEGARAALRTIDARLGEGGAYRGVAVTKG